MTTTTKQTTPTSAELVVDVRGKHDCPSHEGSADAVAGAAASDLAKLDHLTNTAALDALLEEMLSITD